jgi:hypothetical protein
MTGIPQKIKAVCLLPALLILMGTPVCAQLKIFKYKADIKKIDSSGVYRVELSPALIAKSKADLSDIRLVDNTGKFVAYTLSDRLSPDNPDSFIVFPGVSVSPAADTATVYIAENKNILNISQLWIKLKKTGVRRTVNLSGSDDLKKWFAISEDVPLEEAGEGKEPDYQQPLSFPTSNYRYFKIQVNGKNKTPVKILQSGIYTTNLDNPVYTPLPPLKFSSKDTGKITSIFINFDEPYQVNKLHFIITGPKYYNRRVVIYETRENDKNKKGNVIELVCDSALNSEGLNDITLAAKPDRLRIDIYNGDDNPLSIAAIQGFQLKEYAVSYLESGHTYSIFTGREVASQPVYDLSFLHNRIYNRLPGIIHSAVYKNPEYEKPQPLVEHDHSTLLWVVIILVLLVLSFLTLRMVREMK